MKSSSGNAAVIILLLLVAAFVIVAMHEKEFRGSSASTNYQRENNTKDRPGIVDTIISTFTGSKQDDSAAPATRARMKDDLGSEGQVVKKKLPTKSDKIDLTKQKDSLSKRDRAELNELLEKVNP